MDRKVNETALAIGMGCVGLSGLLFTIKDWNRQDFLQEKTTVEDGWRIPISGAPISSEPEDFGEVSAI